MLYERVVELTRTRRDLKRSHPNAALLQHEELRGTRHLTDLNLQHSAKTRSSNFCLEDTFKRSTESHKKYLNQFKKVDLGWYHVESFMGYTFLAAAAAKIYSVDAARHYLKKALVSRMQLLPTS